MSEPGQRLSEESQKRLVSLAEGWECAARLTDEIVKAFQPELDEFGKTPRDNSKTYDFRLIRAVVDERSARDTFLADAAAVREALALLSTTEGKGLGLVGPSPEGSRPSRVSEADSEITNGES